MATLRNRALAAWVVALGAGAGCYKPSIQEGGLLCTDGGACPDGFKCATDGRCRTGPAPSCPATKPHVDPLCSAQPGTECDPICQNRCECGRCSLVGSALTCVAAGAKKRGDLCNVASDDCAPGNICLKDCEDKIARCYRFCGRGTATNDSLCAGNKCDLTLNEPGGNGTEHVICEPPIETCNPVVDDHDCADPALGCYVGPTGSPVCDCRGSFVPGDMCGPYNSCVPGFRCVSLGGPATCFPACRIGGTDCPASTTCASLPGDVTFGFCRS
jgi:hypothetical protein